MLLEERDDRSEELVALAHDVSVQVLPVVVIPPVDDHLTDTEEVTKLVEHSKALLALSHRELV
jgi:hypothetical protein